MNEEAIRILRENDPECQKMVQAGYVLVGASWGAHLEINNSFDTRLLIGRIKVVEALGFKLEMLDVGYV